MKRGELAALFALLAASLGVQLYFFQNYPQPTLFGDPRGYYETGQRFLEALARWRAGEPLGVVFDSVRGLFLLIGVGSIFAALEAVRPGDYAFFRIVLAAFNTLAVLGVFLLGRRLARSIVGGWIALTLGVAYPAFSVQTGRLYPDPITGCLFVWAAWLYLAGLERGSRRLMVGAGLTLTAALLVRTQLVTYMFVALPLAFAASAPLWLRRAPTRRLALALALALSTLPALWWGIGRAVGERDDVLRFGNITYQTPYPIGFWMFIENDGWPMARFKDAPYYLAMWEENRQHPGLLSSRSRQAVFTLKYVAARPLASTLAVLENAYRLYARPANDYKWDYPYPYDAQVLMQRALCVLALAGVALFVGENAAALGVFLLPLSLLALHGVMFSWPRYNVPVMPILIATAGACLARLAVTSDLRSTLRSRLFVGVASGALVALAFGTLAAAWVPEWARAFRVAGTVAALALPFLWVARLAATTRTRGLAALAWCGLAALVLGDAAVDRRWHEQSIRVGGTTRAVEQEIRLTPEALAALRGTRETWLVFDLTVPRGVAEGLTVEIGGRPRPRTELIPTMPRLPESTSTGGRDWRQYPQWWALPLAAADLPTDAATPLVVRLVAERPDPVELRVDRYADQERAHEGPAFGEGSSTVALKLEYDGDYRRTARYTLESAATRTTLVSAHGGERRPLAGIARIRLLTLARNEGRTTWTTAPAPGTPTAFGFFAYSGTRGHGTLTVGGRPVLDVPLENDGDYELTSGPYRLCRRSLGERGNRPYGAFVLSGPAERGRPLELGVRFLAGMSERPMYFIVDGRRKFGNEAPFFERCGIPAGMLRADGAAAIAAATQNDYPNDTGKWTVAAVY